MNDGTPNEEDDKIETDANRNKEGVNEGTPKKEDVNDGLETKRAE